jgi:hypothetical protein
VLIHYYEKIPESNGGYWHSCFLSFNKTGKLIECLTLGEKVMHTFIIPHDREEDSFWSRYTEIKGLNIKINSSSDIEICTIIRDEIDGDVAAEELAKVDGTSINKDSLAVWIEIHEDECIEF